MVALLYRHHYLYLNQIKMEQNNKGKKKVVMDIGWIIVIIFAITFMFKYIVGYYSAKSEIKKELKERSNGIIAKKTKYTIIFKDGTTSDVEAQSYIWNDGKVRFLVNDTVKVKEIPSEIVEEVKSQI